MSLWEKLRGTSELLFQLGLGGPNLKNNGGVIEARNAADSGFAVARAAMPVGDNDLVTKAYADQLAARFIVTAQFNGNNPLPANTGVEHFYVVSTTGANASIGQLLWDDGSGAGTVQVVGAAAGNMIVTTQAFSGGTVSFLSDSLYVWDSVASAWINASGSAVSGAVREIRFAINNAASQSSATQIPANAYVVHAELEVTTPFSGGATVQVGQTGTVGLLLDSTLAPPESLPTVAGNYAKKQDTAWGGSALAVLVTVGGAPAAGAGVVIVRYCLPNL